MLINEMNYRAITERMASRQAVLVAVSKTKPQAAINEMYALGQRDFGENYVQELVEKQQRLPGDIRWHFIGHLQTNKVKLIAPFIHLIHGIDSFKLLIEVDRQGKKAGRVIDVLLQVHIAQEETKFGLDEKELETIFSSPEVSKLYNVKIRGLMGMASFTDDVALIRKEFRYLKELFDKYKAIAQKPVITAGSFSILSMGMSSDYPIALEEGSTMVRIGSLLFGEGNTEAHT